MSQNNNRKHFTFEVFSRNMTRLQYLRYCCEKNGKSQNGHSSVGNKEKNEKKTTHVVILKIS